jgi:hypothetical protein
MSVFHSPGVGVSQPAHEQLNRAIPSILLRTSASKKTENQTEKAATD